MRTGAPLQKTGFIPRGSMAAPVQGGVYRFLGIMPYRRGRSLRLSRSGFALSTGFPTTK
jgi:hypothetical protein